MKMKWKSIVTTGMAFVLCVCMCVLMQTNVHAQQAASNLDITLGTTDNARSGDTVTARILLGNNPGISTFAVKLAYDSNALTYTGATWADSVESDSSNIQMISEVTEDGGQVLNISSILSSPYTNNETIVTLRFTARQDYTTMPVTLTNREITDSSYAPVTANIVVDATAGQTNSGGDNDSESESQTESESESQSESESESQSNNNSQNNNNNSQNSSNNSQNNNSGGNKNSSNKNNKDSSAGSKLDKTPKTGATDIRFLLVGAIVVFLAVAGICIRVLGKKRPQ